MAAVILLFNQLCDHLDDTIDKYKSSNYDNMVQYLKQFQKSFENDFEKILKIYIFFFLQDMVTAAKNFNGTSENNIEMSEFGK